jgi:hypothetical protein
MAMMRRTWFWMRSLTRSMGAAAVFETAAETPPTIDEVSDCGWRFWCNQRVHYQVRAQLRPQSMDLKMGGERRTQEVDQEAGHSPVVIVSDCCGI